MDGAHKSRLDLTSQSYGWRRTEPRTGTGLKEADVPTDIQHEAPNETGGNWNETGASRNRACEKFH